MREILFRGKRIDNGEWIEGYFVKFERREIPEIYTGWNCYTLTPECHGIEPSTVGQYTGLTDKNGKKIFEGDIIVVTTSEKGKTKKYRVEFDNGIFGIRFPAHAYNNTIIPLRSFDYIEIIKGEEND